MRRSEEGFILLTVLFLFLAALPLVLAVQFQLMSEATAVTQMEGRLKSLNLARNGVEHSRILLPGLDVGQLLPGQDGVLSPEEGPWRSPFSFDDAYRWIPGQSPLTDDGLPPEGAWMVDAETGEGHFLLRFSNNPEEPRDADEDTVLVLRSMGITPPRPGLLQSGAEFNQVSVLEAYLRRERVLRAEAPLMVLGSGGTFDWEGTEFRIASSQGPAVGLVSTGPDLESDFDASLSEEVPQNFQWTTALHQQFAETYSGHVDRHRLLSNSFWSHFSNQIPNFFDRPDSLQPPAPKLIYLADGGRLDTAMEGLVVSLGPLTLTGSFHLRGMLVQIASPVRLEGSAAIEGALWVLPPAADGTEGRVQVQLAEQAQILFDTEAVESALGLLPATLMRLRMIYPETEQ